MCLAGAEEKMADSSGGFQNNCKNTAPKRYSGARIPKDPLHRLYYREFGGFHRHHRQSVSHQIFSKLPGRLAFSLRSLVDENVLHDGHVFLGFTKNGQFVLSYTLNVEADEHTAYPIYVYRLQWWRFVPYKKLKKIGEVRLFGEEEIQQDLYIAVCEWPKDDTRIAIHGYCSPLDSENNEKHQCYVTIAAVPPIHPCEDCSQLAIVHLQNGFHSGNYSAPPRCIMHGFTVHTKYELAPPYPSFSPKIFLKLDGVVVVNTGDSLIALSVDIEDNHGGFGFGLYSPRVARTMSTISSVSSPSDDQMSTDSHEPLSEKEQERESATDLLGSFLPSPPLCGVHSSRCAGSSTPKDTTNVGGGGQSERLGGHLRERRVSSTGKENQLNKSMGSPLGSNLDCSTSSNRYDTPGKNVQKSIDVYNFDAHTPTPKKEGEECSDYLEVAHEAHRSTTVRTSLTFPQGAKMMNSSVPSEEINISLQNDSNVESQTLDSDNTQNDKLDPFEKPTALPRMSASRSYGALSLVPPPPPLLPELPAYPLTKTLCSPGYVKYDTSSSTCSSCISSPIILQSDSQCFTYSVRRYIECFGMPPDAPIDVEDDFSLAYHSVLPLEVHGANYTHLRLLTKQCTAPQMPCVVVKQLTLDIEHYLGETVRTKAEWGHRYMSFTDYDVQITDVCPDTSEVIALVFVLIRARPPKDKKHHTPHGMRSLPKLYQSNLNLVWNLKTGSFSTLHIDDLVEVSQTELIRRKRFWQPGIAMCHMLLRQCSIPQNFSQSVHVLTNEAVIKGQSLKMLLDRHHYVAILL